MVLIHSVNMNDLPLLPPPSAPPFLSSFSLLTFPLSHLSPKIFRKKRGYVRSHYIYK